MSGGSSPPRPRFPARIDTGAPAGPARRPALAPAPPLPVAGRGISPAPASSIGPSGDLAGVRASMVRRLAAQGITSATVLQALGTVERHRFVDSALTGQAYEDTSLPIGLGQTISKPGVVARMAELLLGSELGRAGPLGRVLEIGTGCGYQAAVLAQIAREVYSIERLRGLHERAQANLRPYRIANVHLLLGDGAAGYAQGAPYAGIIAAAAGSELLQAWLDQLAVGARLVAPLTQPDGSQALLVVDRTAQGWRQSLLESVNFVPLKSGIA
ncbi:protein-L-isoaspartate(D-aspartate) O-methyltransferase [Xylophilus sp.]|uniref:protein-L-isoaspartate(D-aspartate) O-methyltransferase n=1 Tax=Xylophilus sp. TaxID=2653893 RepID=UPI0013B621D3|nr:protein-L-isoaspartate(D-aspartate) O-methyltransferase [Xylophilus sp.]KAF1045272.1 MAG: Protein-L-isoaspartate O-methyltransferase [Xylophilus sp.]